MTNFERGFRDAVLKLAEEPSVRVVLREVVDDDEPKVEMPKEQSNTTNTTSCATSSTNNVTSVKDVAKKK